jgi:hypothetical protein
MKVKQKELPMKKILNFFFSNDNYSSGRFISDLSRKAESVWGFILFLILPIIGLVWYNVSNYKELQILRKDEQIFKTLDLKIPQIANMKDSLAFELSNNLYDSLEKTLTFAKIKKIKNYGGFWYTDTKTNISEDASCISACKSNYSEYSERDLRTACFSKCIKIIKYNEPEYVSSWSDTVWTDGIVLKNNDTKEQYIKKIAKDSALKKVEFKIDSLKNDLIQNSGIESTEYRLMGYDKYSKEYIDRKFEDFHVFNILISIIIAIYLICLIIRQIVIKVS